MKKIKGAVVLLSLLACVACSDKQDTVTAEPSAQPQNASANSELATVLGKGIAEGQKGDLDGAEKSFRRVLTADSGNKFAWYNLGVIAQQRSRTADAEKNYDRAIQADPGYTPAMYNKAILLESRDVDAAIRLYQQILAVDPKASTTYVRLGLLQVRKGDSKHAEANFATALKLDPNLGEAVPAKFRVGQ